MTLTAVILLIISAFAHTGWNLIGKSKSPCPEFLLLANTVGALCLTPILLKYGYVVAQFTPKVWLLIVLTGLFQAVYYAGLANAYRVGDMSVAYPLMRSIPVVLVMLVNLMLGRTDDLSFLAIIGIAMVALGGCILPVERLKDWNLKKVLQTSTLLALVAAVGTCGYSIIDDRALRILKDTLDVYRHGMPWWTLVYAMIEGLSSSVWLAIFVLVSRDRRRSLARVVQHQFGHAALTGIGIFAAYSLVLVAMLFARNVSYVVAFRQLSIPLGTMLGITILNEPRYKMKFVGVGIMLAGLLLVAVK